MSKVELCTITPADAAMWLERANGGKQRKLNPHLVRQYARDIAAHRWVANGETIKLSGDGQVLDGQHRLHACVRAETAFQSYVVHDVSPQFFDTIDIGMPRSAAAILMLGGVTQDASTVGAVARLIWKYKHYGYPYAGNRPTIPEIEETAKNHPEITESIVAGKTIQFLVPLRVGTFWHWLFTQDSAELASMVFAQLVTGENLQADQPMYLLRERLIKNKGAKARLGEIDLTAIAIKAYVAARDGISLKQLKWAQGEEFPTLEYPKEED